MLVYILYICIQKTIAYIYIYIDEIVLNETKSLTLNSGTMGHKNTSIYKHFLFIIVI